MPDIPFKSHTMPLSLEAIDWGAVRPGSRNLTLFNGLRFLAYNSPVSLYPSRESWFAELRTRAFKWAALMPDRRGFPDSEVRATAESVAAYTWRRRHAVRDSKPSRQRCSTKARRPVGREAPLERTGAQRPNQGYAGARNDESRCRQTGRAGCAPGAEIGGAFLTRAQPADIK